MNLPKIKGVIVPLVTPLIDDIKVDEGSLRKLVDYVIEGGVNGLFAMGTTGEFQYLPFQEQRRCISIAIEETAGRIPVMAGVTGFSVEETIRNIVKLDELRHPPDAVVVAPLVYHSNRNLLQHMERLCQICNFPVFLYNNPGIVERKWKHKGIIPEIVERISQYPEVIGFKDSSGNINYFREILKRCGSNEFRIFQGVGKLILESMQCGAYGTVAGIANAFPEIFRNFFTAYESGDSETARRYQKLISDIGAVYPTIRSIPAILKEALRRKGIIPSAITLAQQPENMDEIQEKITNLLAEYGYPI